MTLTKQQVREILDVYIRAWESQDPALIVTIFTEEATYHERVMGEPIRGRDGIRAYWQSKVVGEQANITCELLNLYLDDGTAIAEWEAEFDDRSQQVRKRMREVALLTFDGPRIASLREYWASEVVDWWPSRPRTAPLGDRDRGRPPGRDDLLDRSGQRERAVGSEPREAAVPGRGCWGCTRPPTRL